MTTAQKITPAKVTANSSKRRLSREQREQQIVEKAIKHFTRYGFAGSTRKLAHELDVTQPLLYRYFPNKEALVSRVYNEVFNVRLNWEANLTNRSLPLTERMCRFYGEYAQIMLSEAWIRLFIFAGLTRKGLNTNYLNRLRVRVFIPVLTEVRHEFGITEPRTPAELEHEIELVWALHASIFYLGVRKWIYGLKIPKDIDSLVRMQVLSFLHGAPEVMAGLRRQIVPTFPPTRKTARGNPDAD